MSGIDFLEEAMDPLPAGPAGAADRHADTHAAIDAINVVDWTTTCSSRGTAEEKLYR